MNPIVTVTLSRDEAEWMARVCKRAIQLCDMLKDKQSVFNPEFGENKESAQVLLEKLNEVLNDNNVSTTV